MKDCSSLPVEMKIASLLIFIDNLPDLVKRILGISNGFPRRSIAPGLIQILVIPTV